MDHGHEVWMLIDVSSNQRARDDDHLAPRTKAGENREEQFRRLGSQQLNPVRQALGAEELSDGRHRMHRREVVVKRAFLGSRSLPESIASGEHLNRHRKRRVNSQTKKVFR